MYSISVSLEQENSPPMSQKRSQCQPEGKGGAKEGSFLPAADLGIPHDMRCIRSLHYVAQSSSELVGSGQSAFAQSLAAVCANLVSQ